jgi:predicted mannosyl-3-phosphoglycerate phosphatase (HAD superfamily)
MAEEDEKTTIEFGGMSFTGGKAFALLTALSTLGGASWGVFEFYKDYMDMKEIIQNIDTQAIAARNDVIETKLDEAIDYANSIKGDLRDQIRSMQSDVDRVERVQRENDDLVRDMIDKAQERFDNKRDSLASDNKLAMDALEDRLNKKLQQALDNPLAN